MRGCAPHPLTCLAGPGDKWALTIPSELAYGDRGAGGKIPGGAALVFELELKAILMHRELLIGPPGVVCWN